MIETLANEYPSESTQQELSKEYQHNRLSMVFKNLWVLVVWSKVALALEGLKYCNISLVPLQLKYLD